MNSKSLRRKRERGDCPLFESSQTALAAGGRELGVVHTGEVQTERGRPGRAGRVIKESGSSTCCPVRAVPGPLLVGDVRAVVRRRILSDSFSRLVGGALISLALWLCGQTIACCGERPRQSLCEDAGQSPYLLDIFQKEDIILSVEKLLCQQFGLAVGAPA